MRKLGIEILICYPCLNSQDFFQSPLITLKVGNKDHDSPTLSSSPSSFNCHQALLERSPVLAQYLYQQTHVNVLILNDMFNPAAVGYFLQWLYTGDFTCENVAVLADVQVVASALEVSGLETLVAEKFRYELQVVANEVEGEGFLKRMELVRYVYGAEMQDGKKQKDLEDAIADGMSRDGI